MLPGDQQSAVLNAIAERSGAAWLTAAKTLGDDAARAKLGPRLLQPAPQQQPDQHPRPR